MEERRNGRIFGMHAHVKRYVCRVMDWVLKILKFFHSSVLAFLRFSVASVFQNSSIFPFFLAGSVSTSAFSMNLNGWIEYGQLVRTDHSPPAHFMKGPLAAIVSRRTFTEASSQLAFFSAQLIVNQLIHKSVENEYADKKQ